MPWRFNPFTGNLDETDIPAFNGEVTPGSAASPSIFFTGDPNTGIYSPGADQVAISTNGTGRLFVDSSGRVLVGADSTSGASTFYDDIVVTNTTAGTGAGITLVANATNGFNAVDFGDTDAVGRGRITYSHADDSLRIDTAGTERLRITSTGALNFVGAGTAGSTQAVSFNGSAPVNSLVIDSTGKVGLGTSTFSYLANKLVIDKGATANDGITIVSSNTSNACIWFADGTVGNEAYRGGLDYQHSSDKLNFYVGGSTNVTIDSSGRLGVGTTGPSSDLHILSSSDNDFTNGLRTTRWATPGQYGIFNYAGGSLNIIATDTALSSPKITFNTSTDGSTLSERARIDSSGRLGLGTSAPEQRLQVVDTSAGVTTTPILVQNRGNAASTAVQIALIATGSDFSDGQYAAIKAYSSQGTANTSHDLAFLTCTTGGTPTERLYITRTGNVGVGTTGPNGLLSLGFADSGSASLEFRTTSYANLAQIVVNNPSSDIGEITFRTRTGGSAFDRAKIDGSGRLLVGTSSARANFFNTIVSPQFQIEGSGDFDRQAAIISSSSTAGFGAVQILARQKSGTIGGNTLVTDGDSLGLTSFQGSDGAQFVEAARIEAFVDGTPGTDDMPGRLVFSTTADGASSPTEHVRINNAGTTTVWSTSAPMLWGRNETSGAVAGLAYYNTATSTTSLTGQVFRVMCDGDVENTNNAYGAISDANLKENIVDANSQWSDLKALQVRKYNFKPETGYSTHTQIGLIAQEVELVSPGLVGESIDEETGESTKSVNYSVLYMKAVKALQEGMERIETLEASNADLLARVSALESA